MAPPRSSAAKRHSAIVGAGECLVLVGADGRGKDVLIGSARRRFSADASLAFPQRIATRARGDNDEHLVLSRRVFRDFEMRGELFVTWEANGHNFALPPATAAALASGCIVVFAANETAVADLGARGVRVRVLEIAAGPDCVRARVLPPKPPADDEPELRRHRLHHGGDLAAAVRAFHALILDVKRERLAGEAGSRGAAYDQIGRRPDGVRLRRGAKSFALTAGPR